MNNYKFINNQECKFFPCHKMQNVNDFNCLFCYCPLYILGDRCGGNFKYNSRGIKDCSNCILPHIKDVGYAHVQEKIREIIELVQQEHLNKNENK